MEKDGNTAQARMLAARARTHIAKAVSLMRAVPTVPEADLNAARDQAVAIEELRLRGYNLYVRALDKESDALLRQGDALLNRVVRLEGPLRARVLALDKKYGIP